MLKMDNNSKKFFIIEGNIGAGKSTLVNLIKNNFPAQILPEPNAQWQDIEGENLLEKFYVDTKRWAYTFQTYAFITRVLKQVDMAKINPFNTQISERSVFSDRYCFALHHKEIGTITSIEWNIYLNWFEWLVSNHVPAPTGFIYLKTSADVCYKRLKKRARFEEETVRLDYLQALEKKHNDWLIDKKNLPDYLKNVPVLVLDCDNDFENDEIQLENHKKTLSEFMKI